MAQPPIEDLAQRWLTQDRNPTTRSEIRSLLASADDAKLELLLRHRLTFGTAGLRAAMGAGYSRMNTLTVLQASQGLCAHLLASAPDAAKKGVVVGCDARHNSSSFLATTAAVFLTKGVRVHWLGQCHTPLVPFAVSRQGAAAGVMVTASHNPKADNGYKVYWGNGCQIIPPVDREIAAAIERNLEPWDGSWDGNNRIDAAGERVVRMSRDEAPGLELREEYVAKVVLAAGWQGMNPQGLKPFVYTPMHGVGLDIFADVIERIDAQSLMHVVASQARPDPEFPTVKFPNPEEKGALGEATKVAEEKSVTLVLANDPDADRFAAAEYVDGQWRQFTGNQLGVLLASHVLQQAMGGSNKASSKLAMLASTVSSRMLSHMATQTGKFHFEETLTGFKWLGNKAQDLSARGLQAPYAYEEAIGFMLSDVVYDKDGIAAAALFLAAAHDWSKQGLTPWSKLQKLYAEFGHFEEANTYLVSPSPDITRQVFESIRSKSPKSVGDRQIVRWRDLTEGYDTATNDHVPMLPVDKSAQMITCELSGDVVFTVRGSGTEPKIKLYIEGRAATAQRAKHAASEVLTDLLREWFEPEKNGLRLP